MPSKNKDKQKNNITELLISATSLLKTKQIPEAVFEAQTLLARTLKKDRVFVIAHPEFIVTDILKNKYLTLINDRLKGWSLAVLTKSKSFYTSDFFVNSDVLVPRPETEIMVDAIIQELKDGDFVFDIGTGSGAIIVSVAKATNSKFNHYFASDKSTKALKVAAVNIKNSGLPIKLLNGDLLQPYQNILQANRIDKLIIAANLPYLTVAQLSEPSIKKEPKKALLSGSDGLWHYQRLFAQLALLLKSGVSVSEISIYCEINPEQIKAIKKKALAKFAKAKVTFLPDLRGVKRFCLISISHHSNY